MQQTGQLNQQAASGTTEAPAVLNGENQSAPVNDEGGQYQPESPTPTQYSAPQAQYGAQQQQYQEQMQQYQDQQQRYRYDHNQYVQNLEAYDLAQYAWTYPQPFTYHYGDAYGLQPLYLLAEPTQQLSQIPVEGPGGSWVGRVRNVQIAPDGRPWRIEIALNRRVSVWVQPGDLRFDPNERVLYTDLTRGQLWNMPGATIESAPF